jgi:hypothetical protein
MFVPNLPAHLSGVRRRGAHSAWIGYSVRCRQSFREHIPLSRVDRVFRQDQSMIDTGTRVIVFEQEDDAAAGGIGSAIDPQSTAPSEVISKRPSDLLVRIFTKMRVNTLPTSLPDELRPKEPTCAAST